MLGPTYSTTIVVVDADAGSRLRLASGLGDRGFGVSTAGTGIAGVEQALDEACDVLVVSDRLPDLELGQFVTMIRAVGAVPIIAVTSGSSGVVPALEAGADDAVTEPVNPVEVEARIKAILRRAAAGSGGEAETISVGALEIDTAAREARLGGREVPLARKEFDLLVTLARRPNHVVSKRELLAEVWNQPYGGADKTVDVHLSWLRRKLGESASEPRYLRTVRGVGVKLVDPEG